MKNKIFEIKTQWKIHFKTLLIPFVQNGRSE